MQSQWNRRSLRVGAAGIALAAICLTLACLRAWTPGRSFDLKSGGGLKWYKGNTHTHTLWSDGDAAPEIAAAWYKDHDYDFLCLSDHNILSDGTEKKWFQVKEGGKLDAKRVDEIRAKFGADWPEVTDRGGATYMRLKTLPELKKRLEEHEEFLLIQAEEITTRGPDVHMNAVNTRELIPPTDGLSRTETMQRYFDAVEEQSRRHGVPMIAHLNHPNWGDGVFAEDFFPFNGRVCFEIYNGHGGVRNWGDAKLHMPPTDRLWDIILTLRLKRDPVNILHGFGTDDTHSYFTQKLGAANQGRGWIMVLAKRLHPDTIVDAIKRGDFYATSGVTLNAISHDGHRYSVDVARESGVDYRVQFVGTRKDVDLSSQPARDEAGNEIANATRVYSSEIGTVLMETAENPAVYEIKGDELYVRAKIVSTKAQSNPFAVGDFETAWTQPVVVE